MAILDIFTAAQNGQFFTNAGKTTNLSAAQAEAVLIVLTPAIAQRLKNKAAQDPDVFDSLLDILENGSRNSDLESPDTMMGAEALKDGAAILADVYGSSAVAMAVLDKVTPKLPRKTLSQISAISATSVLAILAAHSASILAGPMTAVAGVSPARGGIIGTIISALLAGLLRRLMSALMPKRRRSYSSYRHGRRPARRRTRRPSLEDVFRKILAPKK